MIETIILKSLKNRMAIFLLAIIIGVVGWFSYSHLTVEAFPDPTDFQVQVITLYEGQPAEEVERRVSIPIERALNGVPGVYRQRSASLFGLSMVTLTFEDGVDPLASRQQIDERLTDATLPPGVQPQLGPLATPIGEVYRYTLGGKGADPMTLRTIQDWIVGPALMRVPGIADVTGYGGLEKEIHVEPDPAKMAELGIVLDDIFSGLNQASANATGGAVERGEQMFVIRSVGTFAKLDDIDEVRIGYHAGVPIRIRDVAHVTTGYAPRQGVVTRGDDDDAVEGIVIMRRGENPTVVLEALRQRIEDLEAHSLPSGVHMIPFYDRTKLVETTLETVFHNLLEGAILVTAVLFIFLLSIRASLIVAAVIPLSVAAAFIYLHSRGMSANLLSMGALDFGIIVDGAVILVEQIFHHSAGAVYPAGKEDQSRIESITQAAREVARPTMYSLLIIVAAYLPIFALQRVEGRIFSPMANTVVSALIGAMIVSFTLVPVLCFYALRRHGKVKDSPVLKVARRGHDPVLVAAMRNPFAVLILSLGLVIAGVMLAPRLGSEFLPELNEGSIYVTFSLPPTISLTDARKLVPRIKALLHQDMPEVDELLTQQGRPEDGTDAKLQNNLEIFIKLKPMKEWRDKIHTLDDMVEIMASNLKAIPGIDYNFSQPIKDNVNENISGQQGQIALKIYGDDLAQLLSLAEKTENAIQDVPGMADLGIVKSSTQPAISIHPKRDQLARWNLDLASVQNYIETALGGHAASEFWDGEERFDVTVRLPRGARTDIASIQHLRIPLKDGSLIPVSAVADVTMDSGRAAITRENGKRYVGIRMNVRNRDLGSFVAEAMHRQEAKVPMPTGYTILWGGEFENQQRAMKRLTLVLPLALFMTFLLLFSAFGSVWDATLIMINLPIGLLGGLMGLAIAGMTLSVSAAVGFIALLGQAVLNGVLVVSAIRTRRDAGQDLWIATIEGTRERLRAVLMTALLAALGLLPAAMSHAIGSETQRPIAVVVVAGTVTSALLTLIILPVSYYWATTLRNRWRIKRGKPPVISTSPEA